MTTEVRVVRSGDAWAVIDEAGEVVEDGLTHAVAWRIADRLHLEARSPAEKRTDFGWKRRCEE